MNTENQDHSVHRLLSIEKFLGKIARTILGIRHEELDAVLNGILRELAEFIGAERSYIFTLDIPTETVYCTHEWCNSGIGGYMQKNYRIAVTGDKLHLIHELREKNHSSAQRESNYNGFSSLEKRIFQEQNVESFLTVGIRNDTRMIGIIGFDSIRNTIIWTEEDIGMLKVLADMLSIVFEKIRYQKELEEKEKSLTEYYDRMNEDMEIAKTTQKNLVSLDFPQFPHIQITSFFQPFEMVGGDVISYNQHEDYIDILFGDVSGHGVSSAMVSGMVILSFKNSSRLGENPASIMESMNRDLQEIVLNHHIAAVCVRLYPDEKKMIYSYAGHPPIALIRGGEVFELDGMNTPLLTLENIQYFESEIFLQAGDRIVFYSDGCFEVFNAKREFLGLKEFFAILLANNDIKDAYMYIQQVVAKILEYSNEDIRDDVTALIMDVS